MSNRYQRMAGLAVCTILGFATLASNVHSADETYEVLTRGPIHEGFLEHVHYDPVPGMIVEQAPPERVEELPPEHKPADERAIWLPGYWAWQDDTAEFIWLSGVWRVPPPNCRWVPGYWDPTDAGYQWISGFWLGVETQQIPYYDQPPQSLERGPSSPAPSSDYFWLAGCWTYNQGRYQWRAGTWVPCQVGWVWTPARYVYTPRGYIFVHGHWDHPLESRGLLFAPVRFAHGSDRAGGYTWTPTHVVPHQQLFLHMFARTSANHYYFGDYYNDKYASLGFTTWFTVDQRRRGYDPLFDYYRWDNGRRGTDLVGRLTNWNRYFHKHPEYRPPTTVTRQSKFVASHADYAHLAQAVVSKPLSDAVADLGVSSVVRLNLQERTDWQDVGRQTTALGTGRRHAIDTPVNADAATRPTRSVLELPALPQQLRALNTPVRAVPALPRQLHDAIPSTRQLRNATPATRQQRNAAPKRPQSLPRGLPSTRSLRNVAPVRVPGLPF